MLMTVKELIKVLENSVEAQNSNYDVTDSAYLELEEEDYILMLKLGATRLYSDIESLEELPNGSEYPVVLLAKIELYQRLALMRADKIDLTADNNNQIKQSQRFKHYMELATITKEEYNDWVRDGGAYASNGVSSYEVLLSNNHYSQRNYQHGTIPKVRLTIDNITDTDVEFRWSLRDTSHFGSYKVYISEEPIIDMYAEGTKAEDKVLEGAKEIKRTFDVRDTFHRIQGLTPDTRYYIVVFAIERNSLFGYSEQTFTTLEKEEEIDISTL